MFSTFFLRRTLLPFRGGSAGDESKFRLFQLPQL